MPVAESLSKLTLIFSSEHTYSKQLSTSVSMKLKQSLHLFLSYSMAQSSPHGNAVPVGYVYFNFVDDIIFSYNGLEPKTTHVLSSSSGGGTGGKICRLQLHLMTKRPNPFKHNVARMMTAHSLLKPTHLCRHFSTV